MHKNLMNPGLSALIRDHEGVSTTEVRREVLAEDALRKSVGEDGEVMHKLARHPAGIQGGRSLIRCWAE